jgi:hypothetical protein
MRVRSVLVFGCLAGKLATVLTKRDQAKRVHLSELDIELLDFLGNAAEPTWIFLEEMPELRGDRAALEQALRALERRGLVSRTRERSGNPAAGANDLDDWWELTPSGSQALTESDSDR